MSRVSNIESILRNIKTTEYERTTNFLERYNIIDRTKIGDEFEGIAKKMFDKSFPYDMQCISGAQVRYKTLKNSHKVDLVVSLQNSTIPLPNSKNVLVEGDKVLAAFEIKKTLSKKLLVEDIRKLSSMKQSLIQDIVDQNKQNDPFSMRYANRLFENCIINGMTENGRLWNSEKRTKLQSDLYEQFKLQPYMPFTSCFGFSGEMSKEKFIEAFIEGVSGFKAAAWPDIVTCGDMNIVKLDFRPYSSVYYYADEPSVIDLCVVYGFFESNSFAHYVEHIWEKLGTNLSLIKDERDILIASDTVEDFFPIISLSTIRESDEVMFMSMEGDFKLSYADHTKAGKMILRVIEGKNKAT